MTSRPVQQRIPLQLFDGTRIAAPTWVKMTTGFWGSTERWARHTHFSKATKAEAVNLARIVDILVVNDGLKFETSDGLECMVRRLVALDLSPQFSKQRMRYIQEGGCCPQAASYAPLGVLQAAFKMAAFEAKMKKDVDPLDKLEENERFFE